MDIGKAIQIIRKEKQISQKILYQNFCSRRQISRIENNQCMPSLEMTIHICKKLNVSIDYLVNLADSL